MSYAQQLPSISQLGRLAKLVKVFPTTAQEFTDIAAKHSDFGKDTLVFLRLFRPDEIFKDSLDFITRCEEMELLINQKYDSPHEVLHSSEG